MRLVNGFQPNVKLRLVNISSTALRAFHLRALGHLIALSSSPFFVVSIDGDKVRFSPLTDLVSSYASPTTSTSETLLAFVDPCPLATNPGWPLRNLLAAVCMFPHSRSPLLPHILTMDVYYVVSC
jgi:hypothetical protein